MKSGKEKKKKKASISPQQTTIPTIKPIRVTNKVNIPVRQQIAWAKAYKRLMTFTTSASSPPAKKFRQEKEKRSNDDNDDTLDDMDYSLLPQPLVFIDGYNVIGAMRDDVRHKASMDKMDRYNIDLADAREGLISDLSVLRGATGWDIELVFDAHNVAGGVESINELEGVCVIYTKSSETADNYIERRFQELSMKGRSNLVVVTNDLTLRASTGGLKFGGSFLPVSSLLEELRIAYRGWDDIQDAAIAIADRRRPKLGDNLSSDIRNAIEEMRNTLLA